MQKNLLAKFAYLSILWGIFLNLAVVLNANFALELAAGGQFQSFPTQIRVIYFFQILLLAFQLRTFQQLVTGLEIKPNWLVNFFIFTGALGLIINLFSRSSAERWNAIPLAIITFAFWKFRKDSRSLSN